MRSLQINSVAQVALSRLTMKFVMRTIVMVLSVRIYDFEAWFSPGMYHRLITVICGMMMMKMLGDHHVCWCDDLV